MMSQTIASVGRRVLGLESPEAGSALFLDLQRVRRPRAIGNKAENLRFLMERGFRTPAAYVCTWDAYLRYLEDRQELIADLRSELAAVLDRDTAYAVRSSANVEDTLTRSFAGQFKSVLDVRGLDSVLEAIWSVWATAQSPAVQTYLERNGLHPSDLKMAVLVQRMVEPILSGVAFSRNPTTGMDEIVVEAVEGSGEALVQEGATPKRWIYKWGDWIATPIEDDARTDVIREVVRETQAIAEAYGRPVDLEWVYDGTTVHWVQLREITSLDVDVYSNRISREVFPGMIKPLVWSINVPLVNGAWVRLLTQLIGPNDIAPDDLARSFRYRAYFNMGTLGQVFEKLGFPRESLELLMGLDIGGPDKPSFSPSLRTFRLLPRMLAFAVRLLSFGYRVEGFVPAMKSRFHAFSSEQPDQLGEEALIEEIQRLYRLAQETAYYNIVTPLLMQMYSRLLKGRLRRLDVDFESLALTDDIDQVERFDPNAALSALHEAYGRLDPEVRRRIQTGGWGAVSHMAGLEQFKSQVDQFIEDFGHLSDSGNDFSSVPWREDPDLVLQMIIHHVPPGERSEAKRRFADLPLPPLTRPITHWIYRRARRFIAHREAVSSLYTYGYGLFRVYFLALGDRFVDRGLLSSPEDIFHLTFEEVEAAVGNPAELGYQALVDERRREMDIYRDVPLPSIIYGDDALPAPSPSQETLHGTPTSRGRYTGPVRAVSGIRDFDKVEEGDVLAVPYSDVGWTPLFAKAGAVIAESGGLLSHSSIVAREYGIPAVVSVSGAGQLQDNTVVTVDGYRGEITIHDDDERGPSPEPVPETSEAIDTSDGPRQPRVERGTR
jgi:pyruvate,water dikinase